MRRNRPISPTSQRWKLPFTPLDESLPPKKERKKQFPRDASDISAAGDDEFPSEMDTSRLTEFIQIPVVSWPQ